MRAFSLYLTSKTASSSSSFCLPLNNGKLAILSSKTDEKPCFNLLLLAPKSFIKTVAPKSNGTSSSDNCRSNALAKLSFSSAGGFPRITVATMVPFDNGLTNMQVWKLTVYNNNIYAGTNTGLYHSTNNGTKWTKVNNGMLSYVNCLAISGTNIFVGTNGNGLVLSTNNGIDWNQANDGLNSPYVISLLISGNNVFAGTDQNNGVYLSTNNGTSWTTVNNGLTNLIVGKLALEGSNIYAGTQLGLFLSTDNGASWDVKNKGLTNFVVNSLACPHPCRGTECV